MPYKKPEMVGPREKTEKALRYPSLTLKRSALPATLTDHEGARLLPNWVRATLLPAGVGTISVDNQSPQTLAGAHLVLSDRASTITFDLTQSAQLLEIDAPMAAFEPHGQASLSISADLGYSTVLATLVNSLLDARIPKANPGVSALSFAVHQSVAAVIVQHQSTSELRAAS